MMLQVTLHGIGSRRFNDKCLWVFKNSGRCDTNSRYSFVVNLSILYYMPVYSFLPHIQY